MPHTNRRAGLALAAAVAACGPSGVAPAGEEPKLPSARFPFGAEDAKAFRDGYAKAVGLPKDVTNSAGMTLVLIPPGTFEMGPNGGKDRVSLSKPFYAGVTEVTLGQYRRFKPGHRVEGADDEFNADDRPAAMVSWDDARAFCAWLSARDEERAAGRVYTLPTEARWEWAARAGTATSRYFGETDKEQAKFSWFNATYTPNPKHETGGRGRRPVGTLPPNAWGLHDALGNVWEWCADRRTDDATGEARDPVMRGGSWRSGASHCTAVAHDPGSPGTRGDHIGFRVVFTAAAGR